MKTIMNISIVIIFHLSNAAALTDLSSLPPKVLVAGNEDEVSIQSVIKKKPVLIVVGSHDSLVIVNELPKAWLKKGWSIEAEQFISVAAVSRAPWPIRKWIIPSKLKELKEKRDNALSEQIPDIYKSPLIIDFDGSFIKALGINKIGKADFAAFVIINDGTIKEIYKNAISANSGSEEAKQALIEKEALAVIEAAHKDMDQ